MGNAERLPDQRKLDKLKKIIMRDMRLFFYNRMVEFTGFDKSHGDQFVQYVIKYMKESKDFMATSEHLENKKFQIFVCAFINPTYYTKQKNKGFGLSFEDYRLETEKVRSIKKYNKNSSIHMLGYLLRIPEMKYLWLIYEELRYTTDEGSMYKEANFRLMFEQIKN